MKRGWMPVRLLLLRIPALILTRVHVIYALTSSLDNLLNCRGLVPRQSRHIDAHFGEGVLINSFLCGGCLMFNAFPHHHVTELAGDLDFATQRLFSLSRLHPEGQKDATAQPPLINRRYLGSAFSPEIG
ncbi:hypothetical protein DEU56DRAFT_474398 [Suillus clintonianus]|uniref:uncharacterized protein n=1 Tax=Suillus clintonianus TaxID=1904413 RepID=UPI001B875F50|nr:uncharacterized protein DEU56DRAFT_474398 [Suillus clintonianus]KAG2153241.1 hypothetical protein DEU56DRAFT_474398 [Suillus clintonianus]